MSGDACFNSPLLLRGKLTWECMSWSLNDWKESLQLSKLKVRVGELKPKFSHPQWERFTQVEEVDGGEWWCGELGQALSDRGCWAYYDYKYMQEIYTEEVLKKFSWEFLGLDGRDGRDSTLWIGTAGAHTPCHQDTYGYNLVAQVHGSKTWTLFPPDQSQYLFPTRIPYEESSVYSRVNFSHMAKNCSQYLEALNKSEGYQVTLTAGDVLYVPRHWWHNVSSRSFSISVNTWVETSHDDEARLEEALVRLHIAALLPSIPSEMRNELLNPNEDDLGDQDLTELAGLCENLGRIGPHSGETRLPRRDLGWQRLEPRPAYSSPTPVDGGNGDTVAPVAPIAPFSNPLFATVDVLTSESVIRTAAAELRRRLGLPTSSPD